MGYLEIACAGIIWACTGPLLKLIQRSGFTSWDIVLARSIISSGLLGLYIIASPRLRGKDKQSRNGSTGVGGNGTTGNGMAGNGVSGNGAAGDGVAANGMAADGMAGDRMTENGTSGAGKPEEAIQPALDARDFVYLALIGFLAVIFSQTTYFYALSQASVAVAVTLNYTSPFFVMALSFLLYKDPVTREKVAALVGAVFGVALASGFVGPHSARLAMSVPGVIAGTLSGLGYGLQTLVYKRVGRRYGPILLNFWTMAFGSLHLSAILMLVTRRLPEVFAKIAHAPANTLLLLFLIGLGPGTLAFILFADGINKVDATKGAIMAMAEPVAACLLGYFVLGETLVLTQVIGIGLVLGSIWAVSIPEAKHRRRNVGASASGG